MFCVIIQPSRGKVVYFFGDCSVLEMFSICPLGFVIVGWVYAKNDFYTVGITYMFERKCKVL